MMDGSSTLSQDTKKTLKVLVVDDEAIVRNDIKNLFCWEKYGYQLVGEAENGQEALRILETKDIDIVIADIEMPVMNGLDLAAQVLSTSHSIKFIFLTAHSNFEFARSSMRLGIDSYILKHEMSAKVLLNELERMRDSLEKISYQKMACINEAMHGLLCSKQSEKECQKILKENGIEFQGGHTFLISVEIHQKKFSEETRNAVTTSVIRAVNKIETAGSTVFSIEETSVGALIVMNDSDFNHSDWNLSVISCVNHIQEELQSALGTAFFILVSPIIATETELHQAYLRLKQETDKFYFYDNPRIIFCKQEHTASVSCHEEISKLCESLEKRQFQEAESYLQLLFTEKFPELKDPSLFKQFLIPITNQIAEVWNSDYDDNTPIDPVAFYQELLNFENVFQAYEKICSMLTQLKNFQREKRQERIRKIKNYMEDHFAEDISLDLLGNLIGVSEAYMSQLFKQQFGISFKIYLKNIRMKKAEEMLLAGNHRIHDVGEKVGYSSTPYFCLVFKHHFGLTPSEYIRRYSE